MVKLFYAIFPLRWTVILCLCFISLFLSNFHAARIFHFNNLNVGACACQHVENNSGDNFSKIQLGSIPSFLRVKSRLGSAGTAYSLAVILQSWCPLKNERSVYCGEISWTSFLPRTRDNKAASRQRDAGPFWWKYTAGELSAKPATQVTK